MVENPLNDAANAAPRLPAGMRIYVVGDVHGYLAKLRQVHDWIRADLRDRPIRQPLLVHLGDLIDRGPDSAGCVDLLASGPPLRGVPTINLMGNHEWMMLTALNGGSHDAVDRWLDNGGAQALHSWGLKSTASPAAWLAGIPPLHLVFLRDLLPSYARHGYVFVHAGVRPGIAFAQQRPVDLLWIRDTFLNWEGAMLPDDPVRIVVHGHTPAPSPEVRPNRIGLDTGCGKGGRLTCAALEADDVRLFQTD